MISPDQFMASMRDGAAANQAALCQVGFFFSNMFSVTCFCHTLDNVRKHFEFHVLHNGRQGQEQRCVKPQKRGGAVRLKT